MFQQLRQINRRPAPFEHYTAADLWTDEHTSSKMLPFHLDGSVDVSSRNTEFIDRSVRWIASRFNLDKNKSVADFGCGPGLYSTRLAASGAEVTGIDFSGRSIEYARRESKGRGLSIDHVHADYLEYETSRRFDVILMIMCDFCALSPEQRARMLYKFFEFLKPGGAVLLDVYSLRAFDKREETAVCAPDLLDGFWSAGPYFGFLNTFKYEAERVVLDKYTIIEEARTREVYNWLQYFDPESLGREVGAAGLEVEAFPGDVAGGDFDAQADEFAVVARKEHGSPVDPMKKYG